MVEDSHADELMELYGSAQRELVLQSSDPSLRAVANMVTSGAVDLSPQFQRRERWNPTRQSALIESFLLNVPVPPIYLAEDELGQYAVIDGKQRITAISVFLNNTLELRGLEKVPELNHFRFTDLPLGIQNALELRPLRAVTLLKQSNPELKFEVFQRLNTGGEILNAQEIRNVVYRGPLNKMIYRLGEHPLLQDRLKISSEKSPAYKKMQDAEYVLRFLTLSESWQTFSGNLSESMNQFMLDNRTASEQALSKLEKSFRTALETCSSLWGDAAFKRPEGKGWRDQTLAGMYDAQMLAVNSLGPKRCADLAPQSGKVIRRTTDLFDDEDFEAAVRQATNTPSRIVYRTTAMIDVLQSMLSASDL